MWPFRNRRDDTQTIRDLRQELDEVFDSYAAQTQRLGEAKAALAAVQKAMAADGLDAIAADVADRIADIYAKGGRTVADRDVAVRKVIRAAVSKATTGERTG
jgi:hypothetical protein